MEGDRLGHLGLGCPGGEGCPGLRGVKKDGGRPVRPRGVGLFVSRILYSVANYACIFDFF